MYGRGVKIILEMHRDELFLVFGGGFFNSLMDGL